MTDINQQQQQQTTQELKEQVAKINEKVEILMVRMQNVEKIGETVQEILDILKGSGLSVGLVGTAERNKAMVNKHEEALFGNGKKGLCTRVGDLEKRVEGVFGNGSKLFWAFALAIVGVLGTGFGAFLMEAWKNR